MAHLEIIETALRIFDELVVVVAFNPNKSSALFSPDDRVAMLEAERDEYPQQNAELFVLQQVFSTINSTLEINDILSMVLRGVVEALKFKRVILFDVIAGGGIVRRRQRVDLVDKEDVAFAEIGEGSDQVTRLFERGPGGIADVDAERGGPAAALDHVV